MNWMMKWFKLKINNLLLIVIIFTIACSKPAPKSSRVATLPYYSEATFTPQWISPNSASLDTLHRISPFQLINQKGDTISEKTFNNKIYVTDFFFTACPGICPKMTENMSILQEEFLDDKDVLLLSHSVTPERDSVPVLKVYAENKGVIHPKWHLATGTQQEIYKLGRQDYFVEEDLGLAKEADEFLHTENFVLVDKKRHIRGIYNGLNKSSINQLIADIYTLKKEN